MIYTIALFSEDGKVEETITFDSVMGFDESYPSTLTQHAVESGFMISDHIIKGNDKFSLSGVITDSLFRRKGALIQYVNGKFVRMYEDTDPLPTENPIIAMKKRIKKLRDDREVFGVFESLRGSNEFETSQVNLIYPCALSDLSFSNKDGASAIYPNLSFEHIRVASVKFEVVKNPSPELIPHIKHGNSGDQTGATGSTVLETEKATVPEALQTKSAVPAELKKSLTTSDKMVAQNKIKEAELRKRLAVVKVLDERVASGAIPYTGVGKIEDDAVNKSMTKQFGEDWNK